MRPPYEMYDFQFNWERLEMLAGDLVDNICHKTKEQIIIPTAPKEFIEFAADILVKHNKVMGPRPDMEYPLAKEILAALANSNPKVILEHLPYETIRRFHATVTRPEYARYTLENQGNHSQLWTWESNLYRAEKTLLKLAQLHIQQKAKEITAHAKT